jgi:hypothetical protein
MNSYHQTNPKGDPSNLEKILQSEDILQKFNEENIQLREVGKTLLPYDKILNECIMESTVELLKKER